MRRFRELLGLGALGALVCALLAFVVYLVVGFADGNVPAEVAFYGIVFAIAAAFVGAVVGVFVGLFRAKTLGGAGVGLAGIVIYVAVYAISSGGFAGFGESAFFGLMFGAPALLTGATIGWVRTRRERVALTPRQPV